MKGGLTYVGSGGALLALTILAISTTSLGLPIRAFLPVFAGDPNTLSQMMTSLGPARWSVRSSSPGWAASSAWG